MLIDQDAYPPREVAEVCVHADCPVELLDVCG